MRIPPEKSKRIRTCTGGEPCRDGLENVWDIRNYMPLRLPENLVALRLHLKEPLFLRRRRIIKAEECPPRA